MEIKSAFDPHHPPEPELINQCVHCGFCLPACPTYVLWGSEPDSPRGRIYLMKMASEGATAITPDWVQHIDACLGCVACMSACPSGVDYGKLIEATRAQVERLYPRPLVDRLHRRLMFALFPRPDRLRLLRPLLALYQKSGLQELVRRSRILKLFPPRLQAMEALAPQIRKKHSIAEVTPAAGQKRLRVGLMLGCVQREFLSHVNLATVRTLAAEGCEVVAASAQPCCGALMVHAGEEPAALDLARRTIDAFEDAGVDCIVTNAAGCGSVAKDYGYLLRDDSRYAERARRFSAKCRDITEVLEELGARAERHPLPLRVAFHDSCHLQHAQRVRAQPRALLSAIPGLTLLEIPEAAICCGSAGIYNLVQPKPANELADRKAALIAAIEPDVVATGNPGCLLQIQTALERSGSKARVVHTVELIDASIQNQGLL
ncbi:MAG: 4Fe-4S dicluster domain-containing protein [Acidobacteriia bacterium]|nr:4Fe-4S dicluster domain-containing protein [Terriglobia bacterium]